MNPKEKAKELVYRYWDIEDIDFLKSKECALIAVDEIIKLRPGHPLPNEVGVEVRGLYNIINYPEKYWKEVKQEINNL